MYSEGHKEVSDLLYARLQPTDVHNVNIQQVKELILGMGQIAEHNIASNSGVSVRSVETIIQEHLVGKKVCARSGPKMSKFYQKAQRTAVSAKHLHWFQ
jgi:(2Fe-2S) ferredoxin